MNDGTMGGVPDISARRVNLGFQVKTGDIKRMEGMRQQELLIIVSCRPMCLPNAGRSGVPSEQLSAKLPSWQRSDPQTYAEIESQVDFISTSMNVRALTRPSFATPLRNLVASVR